MIERKLPAYPLFVKDPYFSIWTGNEILNKQNVMFWFGTEKKVYGVLKIDGVPYEFMGNYGVMDKMTQTDLKVTAFTTDYTFVQDDVTLNVSFVSPLPLDDMKTLSCPVCYMNYSIESKVEHKYEIALMVHEGMCYNDDVRIKDRGTVGGVFDLDKFEAAWFGLVRQAPLSTAEDDIGADWGYWYLTGEKAYIANETGVKDFLNNKEEISYTTSENQHKGFPYQQSKYLIGVNTEKTGKIMIGFDDVAAIRYYGKYLYDLYFEDGKTIIDALKDTFENSAKIDKHLEEFDKDLVKKAEKFGPEYINILYASLRQSIAMHKLCKDTEGNILFMSRESNSNSCIATVDVSYPSMPLYLLYDTEYVKGMMRPILKFARMPIWSYDFAPHDGGTYPNCDGQYYGIKHFDLNRYYGNFSGWALGQYRTRPMCYLYPANYDAFDFHLQMPVEECANMIIMAMACYNVDKDSKFLADNIDLFEKWVIYLEKYGLIPANQLCTDDFAGHLDKNVNLAIKATVGIECYAAICRVLGKDEDAKKYSAIAKDFASKIEEFAYKFKWCPLTWDSDDTTFSLKYNLAFDKILKLNLFSKDFYEREMDAYVLKCNRYGVPLDSRREFSKSDWLMWVASLTEREDKRNVLISALNNYLVESDTRIPFGDWYETVKGNAIRFIARTVQGGNFILLLND